MSVSPSKAPAEKASLARKSLMPSKSFESSSKESQAPPQKPLFERGPSSSLASGGSTTTPAAPGMNENRYSYLWGLSYEVRLKNKNFMDARGFALLNRQIYQKWVFSEVIGLKARLPLCEITEDTDVISVDYTFKDFKLKISKISEDIFAFFKNRLILALPESQLKRDCRKVRDLFRIAEDLTELELKWELLVQRMSYLKLRYPCQISENSIRFDIQDARVKLLFTVEIDLRSDSVCENSVSVTNKRGLVKEDLVKLIFHHLLPRKDMFYAFVKELKSNTDKLVAR